MFHTAFRVRGPGGELASGSMVKAGLQTTPLQICLRKAQSERSMGWVSVSDILTINDRYEGCRYLNAG